MTLGAKPILYNSSFNGVTYMGLLSFNFPLGARDKNLIVPEQEDYKNKLDRFLEIFYVQNVRP